MGHWAEECGDGVHDPRTFEWGEWLLWAPDPPMDRPMGGRGGRDGSGGLGRMGGRGDRGGRGGWGGRDGGGRGAVMNQGGVVAVRVGMEYPYQEDGGNDRGARKRLIASDGSVNIRGQSVPNLAGKVADAVLMLEGSTPALNAQDSNTTPEKTQIIKRRRQDGGEENDDMDYSEEQEHATKGQAASFVEDRPSQ